tara:strand:+ start:1751 stop:2188 length:438 start_codon:yes stop_codon:yes gene_type:complete
MDHRADITVTGGTQSQRDKVKSMAEFCIKKLMPRMKTLCIEIKLKKINGAMGYCLCETKRDFELEIGTNQRLRRLLETVAHEMVHVKQFARGELNEKPAWLGKIYDVDKTEYWDLPWEIEAHGREVGLFIRWCQENNYDQKWTQD